MNINSIKIGTRSSKLAVIQAEYVKNLLVEKNKLCPTKIEIVKIETKGDKILNQPLAKIGGKGLFTYELEEKLLNKELDLAVHSAKDLPPQDTNGLEIAMFCERENPADVFVSNQYPNLDALPEGALIGTSSIRRSALLKHFRPDLQLTLLRGNINTRLQRLDDNKFQATILAYAGLKRLGMLSRAKQILSLDQFIPAPGQGALAIQTKQNNADILKLLAPLTNPLNQITIKCERYFTFLLDGSCRTPLGAYAQIINDKLLLDTIILSPDGQTSYRYTTSGAPEDYKLIAAEAASKLKEQAGASFFKDWQ